MIGIGLAALAVSAFAATGAKGFAPSSLDEIAARLKPLRTWALPYAAGVPYESYVSRKKAPKDLDKLDPSFRTEARRNTAMSSAITCIARR